MTKRKGPIRSASFGLSSTLNRFESVSGECSPGVDGVPVMRSPLESDDIKIKVGLPIAQPQSTPPCPGCGKTMRLQQTINKTVTLFGCSRFPLCKKDGARATYCGITSFTVCGLVFGGTTSGESDNATGCRISQFGGELQHVEYSNRVTTRTGFPTGATSVSFVFWNRGSESTQSNPSDVLGSTAQRSRCPTQLRDCKVQSQRCETPGTVAESSSVEPQSARQ